MKKSFAISALVIFFLAQFGKVINFCFCSMAAYQQTSTLTCDCEKQLFADTKNDREDKPQSPHTYAPQQATEELFHWSAADSIVHNYSSRFTSWPPARNEALYHVFGKTVFHPPLQMA